MYQVTRNTQINRDEFSIDNHYTDLDFNNQIQQTSLTKKTTFLSIYSLGFQYDLIKFSYRKIENWFGGKLPFKILKMTELSTYVTWTLHSIVKHMWILIFFLDFVLVHIAINFCFDVTIHISWSYILLK